MKIQWELESELALKAVSTGGDLALDRPERMKFSQKESLRDIVTELDIQIEAHIKKVLAPSSHAFLGEESYQKNAVLPTDRPFWSVDPIDGTTNFLNGIPYFGVSVGLCQGTEFLVGAVSLPAMKELFFTHGDRGAFLNGKPLKTTNSSLASSLVGVGFSGAKGNEALRYRQYELFGMINDSSRGALRLGSAAANICYVAAGRLQASFGMDVQIWDVAGALAIAKQAGSTVWTSKGSAPTRIHYAVGGSTVVQEILDLARKKEVIS